MSFVGGKLKLKGGDGLKAGGAVHKKKKKRSKEVSEGALVEGSANGEAADPQEGGSKDSEQDMKKLLEGYEVQPKSEAEDRRTEAEKRYDERLGKIQYDQMKKQAGKSHRGRIQDFNEYLSKLSEHHDLFKISGGARK